MRAKTYLLALLLSIGVNAQSLKKEPSRMSFVLTHGVNSSQISVIETFKASPSLPDKVYDSRLGRTHKFLVEYAVDKSITMSSGISLHHVKYGFRQVFTGFETVDFSEDLGLLSVPFTVGTGISFAGLNVSIHTGIGINYLLNSSATINYISRSQITPDLTFQRRRISYSGLASVKIRKSIDILKLGLSINYRYGLNNFTNAQERYTDQSLVFDRGYLPDDFRLNSLHLDFELVVPFKF